MLRIMRKKSIYVVYLLGIVAIIFAINIVYSQIILLETPSIFKVIGDTNTWILFNGSIIGALIGGLIAGLIAYNIARLQMKEESKSKSESRKIQYREELKRDILLKVLEINLDMQEGFLYKDTLLKNIIGQIDSYNKALQSGNENISLAIKQIQEFFNNNIKTLEEKIHFSSNSHLAFMRVFRAYEIVLKDYKVKLAEIMSLLIPNNNRNSFLPHHLFALKEFVNKRELIPGNLKKQLDDVYENNRKDFNELDYKIHIINVDIQNSFADLFDYKIHYPKYEDVY